MSVFPDMCVACGERLEYGPNGCSHKCDPKLEARREAADRAMRPPHIAGQSFNTRLSQGFSILQLDQR